MSIEKGDYVYRSVFGEILMYKVTQVIPFEGEKIHSLFMVEKYSIPFKVSNDEPDVGVYHDDEGASLVLKKSTNEVRELYEKQRLVRSIIKDLDDVTNQNIGLFSKKELEEFHKTVLKVKVRNVT